MKLDYKTLKESPDEGSVISGGLHIFQVKNATVGTDKFCADVRCCRRQLNFSKLNGELFYLLPAERAYPSSKCGTHKAIGFTESDLCHPALLIFPDQFPSSSFQYCLRPSLSVFLL